MEEQAKKPDSQAPNQAFDSKQGAPLKKPIDTSSLKWMAMGSAMEFALLILVPLLIFLFIEHRYNPGHRSKAFIIIGLLLAIATSVVSIGTRINAIRKRLK